MNNAAQLVTDAHAATSLTVRQFALLLGVDRRYIQRVKAGKIPVSPKILAICEALLTPVSDSPYK